MPSLKKQSAVLSLGLALTLGLAACGNNDESVGLEEGTAATPVAQIDALTGEQTAVTLDPSFLEGLTALELTPATLGGATLEEAEISFPITGGNVTYYDPASGVTPFVQGLIEHNDSGLQLTGANGAVVKLEDFVVDPEASVLTGRVTVDDEVFAESADLFFLDGSTLNPLADGEQEGTAVLEGTTVSLTQTAADTLNMVFGTDALSEFFLVGVAEITIDVPA